MLFTFIFNVSVVDHFVAMFVYRWKIHESCMLAMGSVQGMLVNAVLKSRVQFQLLEFLQSIVLEDLKFSGKDCLHIRRTVLFISAA